MSGHNHAEPPAGSAFAAMEPQAGLSRRSVLWGAAGAGAAGLAAAALSGAAPAFAAAAPAASRARAQQRPAHQAAAGQPVVVHVRDARSGEMDIFAGTSHTRLRDPALAARLAGAAR